MLESARPHVYERGGEGHDGQHEMGGCRGDMHGELQQEDEYRDVDDPAADAEQAGHESDEEAQRQPQRKVEREIVGLAGGVHQDASILAWRDRRLRARDRTGPHVDKDRGDDQHDAQQGVEDAAFHIVRGQRAEDGPGHRGHGEQQAGLVVDLFRTGIRDRPGQAVEEYDRQRNARDRLRARPDTSGGGWGRG